jgi:hypothetical protein
MARFEIRTPVVGFTGVSAGVSFQDGAAVITSDTQDGMSALTYFRQAGYGVLALDGVEADDIIRRGNESPEEESARLDREISALESRKGLEEKRARVAELRADVYGAEGAPGQLPILSTGTAPTAITPVEGDPGVPPLEGGDDNAELIAPPANNASADEWRKWVVDSGRATDDEVAGRSRTALQEQYGADYDRDREAQLKGGASE